MFTIRSGVTAGWRAPAWRVARTVALCASLGIVAAANAAEKLAPSDRQAIEQTVQQQLDAFGEDDAERAFGLATPDIRRLFGSSDRFMRMVRDNYEPVYRHASVRFVRIEHVGGQWVQTVQITDGEGRVWRAYFTMKRQPDKGWKVGGCQLQETNALVT